MKNPSGKVGTAFGHMDFSFVSINTEDDDETEELVDFSDVDYEDDRLGKTNPLSASKTHWGEDSK